MERLQKIISAAGVASRRKAEELITSGLVQVNGQTITELGAKADAGKDHIRVNGKLIKFSGHHVYILLNKPKGYVTTLSDPEGRPTVVDLLHGVKQRVYPVGRLDYASEGLLLLTNDGELANALTKAASHVPKTYLVKVSGQPSDAAIEQLRAGIELPDRKGIHSRTAPAGIQLVHKSENPWYEVTLIEGRNRQIRAMFEQTGHHVEKLKRVRYGPFTLDVHPGKHRNLLPEEVEQLRSAIHRGASATAEASVRPAERPIARPIDRAETFIETELREEARSFVKFQPALAHPDKRKDHPKDEPTRTPKLFGTFAPKPRFAPSRSKSAPFESKRLGAFRGNEFRKKGPQTAKLDRNSSFQKRTDQERTNNKDGARPNWKKTPGPRSGGPGTGGPGTGAPRKWDTRASSPPSKPRLFGERSPGPTRPTNTGARPDWKKSAAPRKWTQGAPSATGRPRTFDRKPDGYRARPDRPSNPGREDSRSDARTSRPSTPPVRPIQNRKPFWQGADKHRPRKPKEEGDFEKRRDRQRSDQVKDRPRRPAAGGFSRPKSKFAKPGKNRR